MNWESITAIIISLGTLASILRVYFNHVKHLRKNDIKIFDRLNKIDETLSAVREWQRIYEKKLNGK